MAAKSRCSEVIWSDRARPSWLRRWIGRAVMSLPPKRTWPASGTSSPVSWPIKVVLPAPFGPMIACSSPRSTASEMRSEATTPPNRLVNPSISSSGSAMVGSGDESGAARTVRNGRPLEQAGDAAARKQHDQQQQGAENDLPVLGDAGQELFQHQQADGAEQRAERGAHAAEHDHDD